jgi:hypothetical protein
MIEKNFKGEKEKREEGGGGKEGRRGEEERRNMKANEEETSTFPLPFFPSEHPPFIHSSLALLLPHLPPCPLPSAPFSSLTPQSFICAWNTRLPSKTTWT